MNKRAIYVVFGITAAAACGPAPELTSESEQAASTAVASAGRHGRPSPTSHLGGQCPDRRMIGRSGTAGCPSPTTSSSGRWRPTTPFSSQYGSLTLSTTLQRYCQYDWVSATGAAPDLAALPADGTRPASDWLDADCQVVVPLAPPEDFGEALGESLQDAFTRQVDWSDDLPVNPAFPEKQTLVSIIDSSPGPAGYAGGTAFGGALEHGYQVSRVVRELACRDYAGIHADKGCMAFSDHPLALPRINELEVD